MKNKKQVQRISLNLFFRYLYNLVFFTVKEFVYKTGTYTCNKVYQIKDDLLCVIANVKGTNADDASKFADTIIAVVYTGGSQYALLQYYTMWIHLTRAEYLYYSTQFK